MLEYFIQIELIVIGHKKKILGKSRRNFFELNFFNINIIPLYII